MVKHQRFGRLVLVINVENNFLIMDGRNIRIINAGKSEQLATMKRDIVIEESLEDLRLNINMKELKKQLKLYEMNSILAEVEKLNPEK